MNILEELERITKHLGVFPRYIDLKNLGEHNLCYHIQKSKIKLREYAQKLGYNTKCHPRNFWTEEAILSEISKICMENGGWPSSKLWKSKYGDVKTAAYKIGLGLKYFREKLGYERMAESKEIECNQCHVNFLPTVGSNWKRQRFCSCECKINFYRLEQNARAVDRVKQPKTCPICAKVFTPSFTTKQKYCDRRCFKNFRKRLDKQVRTCLSYIGTKKSKQTHKLLGYSADDLLERLQADPMWIYMQCGDWHLDHIFPIKAFVDSGISNIALICHLDNLRPMFASDNISKGANYDKIAFETWLANHNLTTI